MTIEGTNIMGAPVYEVTTDFERLSEGSKTYKDDRSSYGMRVAPVTSICLLIRLPGSLSALERIEVDYEKIKVDTFCYDRATKGNGC